MNPIEYRALKDNFSDDSQRQRYLLAYNVFKKLKKASITLDTISGNSCFPPDMTLLSNALQNIEVSEINQYNHDTYFSKQELLNFLDNLGINDCKLNTTIDALVTNGSSHGISLLLSHFLRPERDIILLPSPGYGVVEGTVYQLNGTAIYYDVIRLLSEGIPYLSQLLTHIKKEHGGQQNRIAAFYLVTPDTPAGYAVDNIQIQEIINYLGHQAQINIIHDLSYWLLNFNDSEQSHPYLLPANLPNCYYLLYTFSKTFCIPHARSSLLVCSQPNITALQDRFFFDSLDACLFSKRIISTYMKHPKQSVRDFLQQHALCLAERYRLATELVNSIHELTLVNRPQSGFFLLIDFSWLRGKTVEGFLIADDIDLMYFLGAFKNMIVLPAALCSSRKMFIRFSYTIPLHDIFNFFRVIKQIMAVAKENTINESSAHIPY